MKNYTVLHLHTDLSNGTTNIDSVTKYQHYIEEAKKCNMKAIAFTEHGNMFSWYKKKIDCEKNGIKYIHGVEMYITKSTDEKVRDNYHCCLYAKNYEGFKELNSLVSKAYNREDGHFYYTPRITFKELLNTSSNIIINTACLGGILAQADEDTKKEFIQFMKENTDRCFLEIQHHNVGDQILYNQELYDISKENNIRLIAGTDTHCLDQSHVKGRSILQKSKGIHFQNEEGWDITFKSYDELVESYENQNSLPMEEILEAIENTNVLAAMVEEYKIDTSYKYPKMSDDPKTEIRKQIMKGIIEKGVDEYDNYETEYIPKIRYELETYEHNGALDFMLLESDVKSYARSKGVYAGYSRGSVSGSVIAYLMNITDMDSIKHKLSFERFMNKERVSLADIDSDYPPSQRDIIKDYLFNKEDLHCCDIITFNTVALKGSIRDVGRALDINLFEIDDICKNIEIDGKEAKYRREYKELFEYVDIINGTIVSIGSHPCGTVVSNVAIDETMGMISLATSKYPVSMINMKEIDSQNYLKLDILGLDNIELINKTCELANIDRLTPDNVLDDEKVWLSIRDNTLGIFQWESDHAKNYLKDLFSDETLKRIKANNKNFSYIDLFSVGNGAIRPAGNSYRMELSQGTFRNNGHEALNELLSSTQGFLVYQEQIIDFLHKFCGYTMGEADIVRRGFAKFLAC